MTRRRGKPATTRVRLPAKLLGKRKGKAVEKKKGGGGWRGNARWRRPEKKPDAERVERVEDADFVPYTPRPANREKWERLRAQLKARIALDTDRDGQHG